MRFLLLMMSSFGAIQCFADPGITIEIDIFTPSNPDPDIVKDENGNEIVGLCK